MNMKSFLSVAFLCLLMVVGTIWHTRPEAPEIISRNIVGDMFPETPPVGSDIAVLAQALIDADGPFTIPIGPKMELPEGATITAAYITMNDSTYGWLIVDTDTIWWPLRDMRPDIPKPNSETERK